MKTQPILRAMTLLVMAMALAAGLWGVMPVPVVKAATCTWTGATDTAWGTTGNWSDCGGGVPGSSDTAIISDVDNDPIIVAAIKVGAVTVNNGGSLTISPDAATTYNITTLTINNGGTVTYNNATGTTLNIATFNINDGGLYIHNRAAATPLIGSGRTFANNSTVEIRQFASTASALPAFGNLVYDSSSNYTFSSGGTSMLQTINGVLTKKASGTMSFAATANVNITIGAIDVQAGILQMHSGTSGTANVMVNGNITIGSGATFRRGSSSDSCAVAIGGNWDNNGTFTVGSCAVTFNGSSAQTIGGSSITIFNNLTVNSGATVVIPTDNTPTVSTALTNNGALRQTRNVGIDNTVFLNIGTAYYGVEIDPASTAMGDTTVTVSGNQFCPNASNGVRRCFDIYTPNPQTATVRFYFTDAERNNQTLGSLKIWHRSGSAWVQETGATTADGSGNVQYVQVAGVSAYSPFLLSENNPTAITLAAFTATPQENAIRVTWETASELDNVGFNLYRSESADGPYTQLNETLIPPQFPGEVMGGDYEWLDTDVQPGVVYYYKLEDLDVKGVSTFHGPVSTVVVTAPTAVEVQHVSGRGAIIPLALGLVAIPGLALARRRRGAAQRE